MNQLINHKKVSNISEEKLRVENKNLKELNRNLNSELKKYKESEKSSLKTKHWVGKKITSIFLGKGLKKSLKVSIEEFNSTKRVSPENLSNVLTNIIWRITRVSIIVIVGAILPSFLLFQQNQYIKTQNSKIETQNHLLKKQNRRIDQQTYLQESNRRSSLIFLTSDIMNSIDEELKDKKLNPNRILSPQLVGRIVSLSRNFKPYKYLKNDSLTQLISPERSQLLISLVNAELSNSTYSDIFTRGDFSYSEINNYKFENINFGHINFDYSHFDRVEFLDCNFLSIVLTNVYANELSFDHCYFGASVIKNSKFNRLNFFSSYVTEYLDLNSNSVANSLRIEFSSLRAMSFENNEFHNFHFSNNYITYFKVISEKPLGSRKINLTDSYFMHLSGNENFLSNFKLNQKSKFYKFYLNELTNEKSIVNYFDLSQYSLKTEESGLGYSFIINNTLNTNIIKKNIIEDKYPNLIVKSRMVNNSTSLIKKFIDLHKIKN